MPTVIAETDEVLVVNKPAGLIVHSDGRTQESTLAEWILKEYPALLSVGEPWISPQGERIILPGIVHRLDRTTSGVLLIAKTRDAYAYLKNEFKARRIEKVYRAFVYGHMKSAQGKIVAEIMRSSEPPKHWYARPCEEDDKPSTGADQRSVGPTGADQRSVGRAAITEWRLLQHLRDPITDAPASYVEARPLTGRTHQIRVHFASIGHPLVADHLYAPERKPILGFSRPALHAFSISVVLQRKREIFLAPLPDDFRAAGFV